MKVILVKDVAKVGRRNSVVEVPNGHALNMLIPKGLALPATPENVKRLQAQKDVEGASQANKLEQFQTALSLLEDKPVVVSAAASAQGHLFEALKVDSIIGSIGGFGAVIHETQLKLENPIKEVGEHEITLHEGEITKKITITVEAA